MGALIVRGEPHDGDGSGYGYGSGDGSGYGYGDGSGSGYGYGYGNGSGDGSGSGSGYGYGSGDGSGYGSGYGYGSQEFWLSCLNYFTEKWSEPQRHRLAECRNLGLMIAYWRSDKLGRAANGGKNAPVKVGTVEESAGPLELCHAGTLHATLLPPQWKGERIWIVALHGQVVGNAEKFGCLKREILGEAL